MSDAREIIKDTDILIGLQRLGFEGIGADEGRLLLLELLSKAGAGCYNSHAEEGLLSRYGLMKSDRTPNKKGLKFICSMVYRHSNLKPECFNAMRIHRSDP